MWDDAELILKVKEPIEDEYHRMHEGLTLFTYLHLAADRPLTEELLKRKVTWIAYETVEMDDHSLPLLSRCRKLPADSQPRLVRTVSCNLPAEMACSSAVAPVSATVE